jgi:hypothetical protein
VPLNPPHEATGLSNLSGGIMSSDQDGRPQKPPLKVLDVNLTGTIYCIKLFLHHIAKLNPSLPQDGSPKAQIIVTGSEGGLYALPQDPVYCSSKHGVMPSILESLDFHQAFGSQLVGLTRSLGPSYLSTYSIPPSPLPQPTPHFSSRIP